MPARKSSAPKSNDTAAALTALSEQVAAMSRQLAELTELVRAQAAPRAPISTNELEANGAQTKMNPNPFAPVLLSTLAELDRDGKVAISDVRNAFVERGWTRAEFDARLLEAEQASLVDLKAAAEPTANLEAMLVDPTRGPLEYVVVR